MPPMDTSMRRVTRQRFGSGDAALTAAELAALMNGLRQLTLTVRRSTPGQNGDPRHDTEATSAADMLLLRQLEVRPASSIAELARRMHVDRSGISVAVTRLAERGLVARATSPLDRRRTVISLTAAGRASLSGDAEDATGAPNPMALLPRSDVQELVRRLTRLASALLESNEVSAA